MLVKERITSKIERLLSKVYYCRPERLREDSAIFSVNTDVRQVYIKIAAYRNCTVICTSEDLQEKTRKFLRGKSRDEIFELPLVYGQTIHYVPGNLFSGNLCESCVAERLFCFIRHLSQILVLKWQPVDVVTYPYGQILLGQFSTVIMGIKIWFRACVPLFTEGKIQRTGKR